MVKSNAERQRDYRARVRETGTLERLCVMVTPATRQALARLAKKHRLSQRAMLEQLIENASAKVRTRN